MAQTPFIYNASLEARLGQLVNKEYGADVFFKVGDEFGELMFAHKVVITTASEVLYVQLNGKFEDASKNSRSNPIPVKDINPTVFLEILRFMYCEELNLGAENLVEVYYAANKYLLNKLINVCDEFVENEIREDNVLDIFNDNRRYEFDGINATCLRVICDNPLECFDQKQFLALDLESLKLILECPKINCHDDQLVQASEKWLKSSPKRQELSDAFSEVLQKRNGRELHCQKLLAFSKFSYSDEIFTDLTIEVFKSFSLYGFGIIIGSQSDDIQSVKLNIKVNDLYEKIVSKTMVVPVKPNEVYVHEIMFKKIAMKKDINYRIVIKMEAADDALSDMFYLNNFQPAGCAWRNLMDLVYTGDTEQNCLSYLLYNEENVNS